MKKVILQKILLKLKPEELKFLYSPSHSGNLSYEEEQRIVEYILDDTVDPDQIRKSRSEGKLSEDATSIIYSLRGFFGFGIFEHCLTMRCRVNYGVPDS